ncbi:hypothetical protein IW138_001451 [Coemansia sp. RSA 986]|nr:hypothetical protein IW138_001451 [Coemansia sp. RSA 986]
MSRPQPSQRQQAKETAALAAPAATRSRQRPQTREQSSGPTPELRDSIESSENEDGFEESPDDDLDDNHAGMTSAKSRQRQRRDSSAASGEQDSSDQRTKPGGGRNGEHGNCTAGSNCFFSHDMTLLVEKSVCKYFSKGNCRYGNKCALLHIGQNDNGSISRSAKPGISINNARNAQNIRAGSGGNGASESVPKGSMRSGSGAGSLMKRDRVAAAETAYSDAAAGRMAGGGRLGYSGAENKSLSSSSSSRNAAFSQGATGSRTTSSASPPNESSGSVGSNDNDVSNTGAWTSGSIGSALRDDRYQANQKNRVNARNRNLQNDSGVFEFGQSPTYGLASQDSDSITFGEQHGSNSDSPLRSEFDISGGHGTNTQSQPIPKPGASGFSRPFRGGNDDAPSHGGLSMQDSMRIDNLALSHGAAHQPFASSPFLSSSIPLLDQFKDIARPTDALPSASGSPMAQSFARSPHGDSSNHLMNRHAFTAVNGSTSLQDSSAFEAVGSSHHTGYHGSLQPQQLANSIHRPMRNGIDGPKLGHLDMSPAMDAIGGARSVPRNTELFGRSFRSSSLANDNEPFSPLASLAAGADFNENSGSSSRPYPDGSLGSPVAGANRQAATGRLRSNSHILSPTLSGLSTGTDLMGIGNNGEYRDAARPFQVSSQNSPFLARDNQGGGYLLTDIHSLPFDTSLMSNGNNSRAGMGGIWDTYGSYSGADASLEQEQRQIHGQKMPYQQQLQNWAQSVNVQRQSASNNNSHHHSSPFASAISNSYNDHSNSMMMGSQIDGTRPGAIGQRLRTQNDAAAGTLPSGLSGSFSGGSQLSSIFGSAGLSLPAANSIQANSNANSGRFGHSYTAAAAAAVAAGGSMNGSSTTSDNYDDLFELEQDAPARSRVNNGTNNPMTPNPQFISMEGFAQRFSSLTTFGHAEGSSINAVKPKGINMPITGASALSRPSV